MPVIFFRNHWRGQLTVNSFQEEPHGSLPFRIFETRLGEIFQPLADLLSQLIDGRAGLNLVCECVIQFRKDLRIDGVESDLVRKLPSGKACRSEVRGKLD